MNPAASIRSAIPDEEVVLAAGRGAELMQGRSLEAQGAVRRIS